MASSISSSIFLILCFTTLTMFVKSEAKQFIVGGDVYAWSIPATSSFSLNKWAESNRFQIGDSLVWKYDPSKDSVLQVTRESYLNCNISNPMSTYKNDTTVVTLSHSGAYYFISGNADSCLKGEKIIVVVMSEKHSIRKHIAPAPSPTMFLEGPALAPVTGGIDRVGVKRGLVGVLVGLVLVSLGF
ncbi:hypothetical protein LUZ60_008820 [Juncus effusus]|nr:hypothetical protein LUZ60_008820 [Juncus effusus]